MQVILYDRAINTNNYLGVGVVPQLGGALEGVDEGDLGLLQGLLEQVQPEPEGRNKIKQSARHKQK